MTNAYFLDHIYHISISDKQNSVTFQPLLLHDLSQIWSKTCLIEGFLRYYDFIDSVERATTSKKLKKEISKSKSKLLFYLTYIKDGHFNLK